MRDWEHQYHKDTEELDYAYYEEDCWDGHRFWVPLVLLLLILAGLYLWQHSQETVIIWEPGSSSTTSTASGQNAVI